MRSSKEEDKGIDGERRTGTREKIKTRDGEERFERKRRSEGKRRR